MPRLALALCVPLPAAGGSSAEQQCVALCPQPSACSLASQPALTGAGPAPSLAAYTGLAFGTARVVQIGNAMTSCAATDLDREYARTMISLMAQSRDAANLGTQRLTRADIRDQARLVARVNENEMAAFQRWLATGFLTEFDQQRYECALYGNCPWGYGYPGWWY